MNTNNFDFKLGEFACSIINDGKTPFQDFELETMSLFVNTGKNKILIDTGWGAGNAIAPHAGLLTSNMEVAGVHPGEIDTVILSHAHPDHIGGNIDTKGNQVFTKANYFMSRKEWEFWTNESNYATVPEFVRQAMLMTMQKNLLPLKDKITLFDNERVIVPGVSCIAAPGHSPGHIALIISSSAARLLCLFDAFHRPLEIRKTDIFMTPPATEESGETRAKLLSQAARPDTLVFAGHFPFPGLGRILRKDDTWQWQTIP